MIKKLRTFLFGVNDWYTVWERTEDIKVVDIEELWGEEVLYWELSWYTIMFSPTRNRYRLKCKGFVNKQSSTYKEAIDTLNHYEKQL